MGVAMALYMCGWMVGWLNDLAVAGHSVGAAADIGCSQSPSSPAPPCLLTLSLTHSQSNSLTRLLTHSIAGRVLRRVAAASSR